MLAAGFVQLQAQELAPVKSKYLDKTRYQIGLSYGGFMEDRENYSPYKKISTIDFRREKRIQAKLFYSRGASFSYLQAEPFIFNEDADVGGAIPAHFEFHTQGYEFDLKSGIKGFIGSGFYLSAEVGAGINHVFTSQNGNIEGFGRWYAIYENQAVTRGILLVNPSLGFVMPVCSKYIDLSAGLRLSSLEYKNSIVPPAAYVRVGFAW